jgi:dimethylhistidine N-methyltransferase
MNKVAVTNDFYTDVMEGLTSTPKHLSSKYFYDKKGDKIFQQIMNSPEYYLTRCEASIFMNQTCALVQTVRKQLKDFDVVELGAGDATKSVHLLKHLSQLHYKYTYYPIDISANIIKMLENELPEKVPGLVVKGLRGDYLEMLDRMKAYSRRSKLVLFLGSNIGNMTPEEAEAFLDKVHAKLNPGDLLLIGFDLKKNPRIILDAYNDKAGHTRNFNLNLLDRINKELGADFNTSKFMHYPVYDPTTGACKSYLISLAKQRVYIGHNDHIDFKENEPIYMEISQKYTVGETNIMALSCGFKPVKHFYDPKGWFMDAIWQVM